MVREQNLLHMYSLILDIRETANFDFPFPHASSYQAKSNLVLGDSQDAVMSTTVSSETCLLQGRLGEWVRESSQSNNNKFNDRGVLRNKFCTTEAGHIKSNDVLHLAYDGSVSENDCIIEHGISNSKIDSNGSYDKLVSPVKGETSNSGYQFPFAASCQAKSSFLVLGNNDTDISKNQATIFMWLMLAGGFKNSPALRLYLAHGFDIIGMYGTAVMMSLCNVREESVNRSLKQLVNRLESTFLLSSLKQNQAPPSVEDSKSQEGPSATVREQPQLKWYV